MPRGERQLDDRIRVLFLDTKRQPRLDADTWVHLQVMRELDRSRVEVHAACVRGPANCPTPTYERLRGIPEVTMIDVNLGREIPRSSLVSKAVAALSLVPAAWSVLRLAWHVHRRGIDVIHTADRPPRRGGRCSPQSHHPSKVHRPRTRRLRCRVDARDASAHDSRCRHARIAISEYVAGTLREAGCDPRSSYVVLNGIEPARWQPGRGRETVRHELEIADTTPVLLTVCRLFPAKGVSELIQALHDVSDEVPTAVLLVVGEETQAGYLDELREMVRAYDVDGRVRFLGRRDDVPALMAGADVFAMPSMFEPFGLVFAEAMAMALPVVALDNGGTVEVVEQGVTGLLSAPGDRDALAANLRRLLLDPDTRAAYGKRGRERVEQQFTTKRMADDTANVFADLLGRAEDRAGRSGTV